MFTWYINLNNNMQAFIACIFTWSFTLIGILLALLTKKISNNFNRLILALSSGILFASCILLFLKPIVKIKNVKLLIFSVIFSILILILIRYKKLNFFKNINKQMLFILAIHNIPEGIVIASFFSSIPLSRSLGMALSTGLQNIPDGITTTLFLKNLTYNKSKIFIISIIISLFELIPGILEIYILNKYLFLKQFIFIFSFIFIIYILFSQLIPESVNKSFWACILFITGFVVTIFVN